MKILIIGPLGAGKSTLAYRLNKEFGLPRLNLDEVCRNKENGAYRTKTEQAKLVARFLKQNRSWVMEGCQKDLYEPLKPDLIVDMRISRWMAVWRFTVRFIKAKKLIGRKIPADLPVQAYHYRPVTLQTIRKWDQSNQEINVEITAFLARVSIPVIRCRGYKDYPDVLRWVKKRVNR